MRILMDFQRVSSLSEPLKLHQNAHFDGFPKDFKLSRGLETPPKCAFWWISKGFQISPWPWNSSKMRILMDPQRVSSLPVALKLHENAHFDGFPKGFKSPRGLETPSKCAFWWISKGFQVFPSLWNSTKIHQIRVSNVKNPSNQGVSKGFKFQKSIKSEFQSH